MTSTFTRPTVLVVVFCATVVLLAASYRMLQAQPDVGPVLGEGKPAGAPDNALEAGVQDPEAADPAAADDPEAPQPGSTRAWMTIVLKKDGQQLEGVLSRFTEGVYVLESKGKFLSILEQDIAKAGFRPAGQADLDGSLPKLLEEFRTVGWQNVGPLIPKLAAHGPVVIAPLIDASSKDAYLGQAVSKVFLQMGPKVHRLLIEKVRKDTRASTEVTGALSEAGPDAYPILRRIIRDKDPEIRKLAMQVVYNLSSTGGLHVPKDLAPVLIERLEDTEPEITDSIPVILQEMDCAPLAIPALLSIATREKRPGLQQNSVSAVGALARDLQPNDPLLKTVITVLSKTAVTHDDTHVRAYSAAVLGLLGDKHPGPEAIAAVKQAAGDKRDEVRQAAQKALVDLGVLQPPGQEPPPANETPQQARARLVSDLFGDDHDRAHAAHDAIVAMPPEAPLLETLMQAVREDEKNQHWHMVARVLSSWDRKVQSSTGQYAQDREVRVRRTLAMAWERMSASELPAELALLARDSDGWVRGGALDALAKLTTRPFPEMRQAIVPILLEGLADETLHRDTWYRVVRAVKAVGVADPRVVPGLIQLMRFANEPSRRYTVAGELGQLGRSLKMDDPHLKPIIDALVKAVADESDKDARIRTVWAIGSLGPRGANALPAVTGLLDDPYQDVADAARDAINAIQGKKAQ